VVVRRPESTRTAISVIAVIGDEEAISRWLDPVEKAAY
jgi:hypothetical protein